MRKNILLLAIFILSITIRFWKIDMIPPVVYAGKDARLISATLSFGSIILLYFFVKELFRLEKISLLSAWVMSVSPWSIEQGRINSAVNRALFFILFTFIMINKVQSKIVKFFLYLLLPVELYIVYPQFWLFQKPGIIPVSNIINNLFILISPDLFFFKNVTFWWGGVREFGIIYLSFLPFFLFGLYEVVSHPRVVILAWWFFVLILSGLSPFFPESREFFLVMPVLSITIAFGIIKMKALFSGYGWVRRSIILLIFLFVIYDMMQFFHFYTIHYPQRIRSNISNIHNEL